MERRIPVVWHPRQERQHPLRNDPEQQRSESPAEQGRPTESYDTAPPPMLAVAHELHALVDEYRTYSQQDTSNQRWSFWLSVTTAFLLLVYTTVTVLLWCETRRTVRLTAQSLEITREGMRADLVASEMGLVRSLAPGENIVNVRIKNTGPTRATRLGIKWHDWTCDGPPSQSCLSRCPFFRAVYTVEGPGSLGRDVEQDVEVPFSLKTAEEVHAIREKHKTLYICGMVGYTDVFRNHHQELPCGYYRSDDGRFMQCFGERSGY